MSLFQHKMPIPRGVEGEVSKIYEEVYELVDARQQSLGVLERIEEADVLLATAHVIAPRHIASSLFLAWLRVFYKRLRRFVLGPKP